MRYLVTGGAGFIGSHLVEALLGQGGDIVAIDDLSTGSRANLAAVESHPRFRMVEGPCGDVALVDELVRACDAIFHMASVVGVRRVLASPIRTLTDNIGATATVLRLASKHGKPVLFASSSEVYGRSQPMPLREDADLSIGSPESDRWSYACSKATCEFLARAHFRETGLPVVIARLFNTVGPRQSGRYGMVIPTFVHQGLTGADLTVFGDGRQTRCFVHVADVVAALMALMMDLLHDRAYAGQAFNVGNNQPIAILDLAHRIRDLTGGRSSVVRIPYEEAFGPGFQEPLERLPDISKMNRAFGWTPRLGLDRILADVVAEAELPHADIRPI